MVVSYQTLKPVFRKMDCKDIYQKQACKRDGYILGWFLQIINPTMKMTLPH